LSKVQNRMKLSAVCGAAIALFFVAATRSISAQAPPPAPYTPGKAPHVGGNSFEGPKDVVYLPVRPLEDTRLNMYFGDWRNSEPNVMFGSLVVRDILTPGDNLSPPYPGAVLEHAKFLSFGKLEAGGRTVPSTLKGLQVFFYVSEGEGEVSGGGKTEPIHKGSAILIPEGLEFTLHNTGETQLTAYMVGDPTYPGFKPLSSFVVKDEDKLPHSKPADVSPFTNPGAGGHWAHITHGFFNRGDGLATVGAIITVEILPLQLGEPHPHFPGHEEIWCEIEGKSVAFVGSQLRMQHPGEAYMLRPDNLTTHSNINFGEPGDKPIKFLWFSTSTKVSTTPH
jgi:mannose-6-phosphate isomerase-like protein (cupin superfamily)